jgi:hypothetical protein
MDPDVLLAKAGHAERLVLVCVFVTAETEQPHVEQTDDRCEHPSPPQPIFGQVTGHLCP